MGQAHDISSSTPVSASEAEQIARVMSALGTSSRVRILARLREGSCTVSELREAVGMEQPAVSHQLRILRDLGLVVGGRQGRHVLYALHDPHVTLLLDEALRHIRHLQAGEAEPATPIPIDSDTRGARMSNQEHPHEDVHAHEHEHDGDTHVHPHTDHEHEHVEHVHEHEHDGEQHEHPHVHQEGLEDAHEHAH